MRLAGKTLGHERECCGDADVAHWDGTVRRGDTGHVMAEESQHAQHGRRVSSQGRRSYDASSVERGQSPSRGGAPSPSAALKPGFTSCAVQRTDECANASIEIYWGFPFATYILLLCHLYD